jgi:type IV pilus assembly protein PilM
MKMAYNSLIISNNKIKVLSLKDRQVKKWGSLDLKPGLVRDGFVLDPQAVGGTISEVFKTAGIRTENVAVSLAGLSFTYRYLKLPRLKSSLQEEAIMRAARHEMSVPLEDLYLAWQLVPGKGEEQTFFILGVARKSIDAAVDTLNHAGIKPYAVELQSLALARAAGLRDAIMVNLERDFFDIMFVAGGLPEVIHTFSPRGEGATLEDNIRRLADELNKTATFYQSHQPENPITSKTPLFITGEMAAEPTAGALLQGEVDWSVQTLKPPAEFSEQAPAVSYTVSAALALNYTTHNAPALTREGYFDVNINLLTGKYRKIRKPVAAGRVWLTIILILVVGLLYPLSRSVHNLKIESDALEYAARLANHNLAVAQIEATNTAADEQNIQAAIKSILALKDSTASLLGERGSFTENLKAVATARPQGIIYTSSSISRDKIILHGQADSVFTVISYATALESVPYREVRISRMEPALNPEGTISFEIIVAR